jgi:RNA polymerase sigma-70 factor (ECF subfamily)
MTGSNVNTNTEERCDSTLIALAKAGNAHAIDEIIHKHWPDAYRTAEIILRCHADADEATQDAFCSAIAHLSTFRGDSSFRTWIHRIAVNQSLMLLRRKHARADVSSPIDFERAERLISKIPSPEQVLLHTECRNLLKEGLQRLPERYLAILQLSVFEGRSTEEIAASVGLSLAAVKTRLHRGRARLRLEVSRRLRCAGGSGSFPPGAPIQAGTIRQAA